MFDAITHVIEGKLAGPLEKLSNQRHLRAIRDGIIATLPIIIVSSLLMVVALYYYLKIIIPLFEYGDKNLNIKPLKSLFTQNLVLYITTFITVFLGIFPEKLIELCKIIAYNI